MCRAAATKLSISLDRSWTRAALPRQSGFRIGEIQPGEAELVAEQ
jgi:hypothetical protein